MDNYYGGCDIGSTTGKAVIIKNNEIAASAIIPREIDPEETAILALKEALGKIDKTITIDDLAYLVGTGYGRSEIPFAGENISEISCHAMGAYFCNKNIKTIVDIGGQDVKGIAVGPEGSVLEFAMNDKCAAGTGRFFEAMGRTFKMELDEFSELSLRAKKSVTVTSQCSVFAESEVISLLASKTPPEDIAAGIQNSVARRCFTLLKRVGLQPAVTVTGGCAKNRGLIKSLEHILKLEVVSLSVDPQLMGALGAALYAEKRA